MFHPAAVCARFQLEDLLGVLRMPTVGLPMHGSPELSQAELRQRAQRNGFDLCIRIPPALHRKSTRCE